MKLFRYVWLLVLLAGLLFVGAAFASDAPKSTTSGTNGGVVMGLVDDCNDVPSASASIDELPDAALITGQSDDQACRDCHTNEELLQELAVEEEVENLSEGPG
jgi:hypothetical protein